MAAASRLGAGRQQRQAGRCCADRRWYHGHHPGDVNCSQTGTSSSMGAWTVLYGKSRTAGIIIGTGQFHFRRTDLHAATARWQHRDKVCGGHCRKIRGFAPVLGVPDEGRSLGSARQLRQLNPAHELRLVQVSDVLWYAILGGPCSD